MYFRNCYCAALFEFYANNPKTTRQRCIFFEGEDPERTGKLSNNGEFYVKVKFIPRTQADFQVKRPEPMDMA